eukprot:TRINITY_DN782_c0_g1_i1.p1 TRINITY_DN782_c0_g1~~TRINITY_DN782_c0_g1_i1.p1  ORF type:complete len:878 (+),score=171.93 TRINITY_DN782_c0_g1_i1:90-2636(+)
MDSLNDLMSELGVNDSNNNDKHLMGLMNDLTSFSSQNTSNQNNDNLDDLLNDLDQKIESKPSSKQPSRFTVTNNELDDLMNDLTDVRIEPSQKETKPKQSEDLDALLGSLTGGTPKAKVPPSNVRSTANELDDLMNSLSSPSTSRANSNADMELDTLLNDLNVSTSKPATTNQTENVRDTGSELDSLLNDLNTETVTKPTVVGKPLKPEVRDTAGELDSLLEDLSAPSSSSKKIPDSELDSLMNDLAGISNTHTVNKAPLSRSTTNQLDDLMNDLNTPGPKGGYNNVQKGNSANNELDDLMRDLTPQTSHNPSTQSRIKNSSSELDDLMNDLQSSQNINRKPASIQSQPRNTSSELDDLMNDLQSSQSSKPTSLQSQPRNTSSELDDLMNDLQSSQNINRKPASIQSQPRNTSSELDDLMNDLQSSQNINRKPASIQSQPRNTSSELDDLMNDLQSSQSSKPTSLQSQPRNTSSELDDLMNDLQTSHGNNRKPTSLQSRNTASELDDLMNGLGSPSNVARKPAVNNELESLMMDLQAPSVKLSASAHSNASLRATSANSELDNLVADLQGKPTERLTKTSNELDSLVSDLNRQRTGNSNFMNDDLNGILQGLNQPAGTRTSMGMNNNSNLDRIMDQLNTVTPSGMNVGGVPGSGSLGEGICAGCRQPIMGGTIQALGKQYHPEHFMCTSCGSLLGAGNFFEQEGQPQCENCFQNYYSMRCAACGLAITNQVLTALDQHWHTHCFVCTNCLGPFDDGNFFEKDSRPYCSNCYFDVFAPRCRSCDQAIQGPCVNALGGQWHPQHFICHYCKRPFPNGAFYDIGGLPYCEAHYQLHQQRVMQGMAGLTPQT